MAVMQSLQIGIRSVGADNVKIKDALSSILLCLQRRSGKLPPPIESYTITSFDIDRQERIGRGGFSEVFKGSWRGSEVAVKVLHRHVNEKMILREVKVWNGLRHPHVLRGSISSSAAVPCQRGSQRCLEPRSMKIRRSS